METKQHVNKLESLIPMFLQTIVSLTVGEHLAEGQSVSKTVSGVAEVIEHINYPWKNVIEIVPWVTWVP